MSRDVSAMWKRKKRVGNEISSRGTLGVTDYHKFSKTKINARFHRHGSGEAEPDNGGVLIASFNSRVTRRTNTWRCMYWSRRRVLAIIRSEDEDGTEHVYRDLGGYRRYRTPRSISTISKAVCSYLDYKHFFYVHFRRKFAVINYANFIY